MSYAILLKDPVSNEYEELNITYNYSHYYNEVYDLGIRTIYGFSGRDSIPMLEGIINSIVEKYKDKQKWNTTKKTRMVYYDAAGNELRIPELLSSGGEYGRGIKEEYEVNEGDTSDYWLATAANALKPIYQLLSLAILRPDWIWYGD